MQTTGQHCAAACRQSKRIIPVHGKEKLMKITKEIDVRGLPPPVPFEKIVHALKILPAGAELTVLIHREPYPLYDVMRASGFVWKTQILADDNIRIIISNPA